MSAPAALQLPLEIEGIKAILPHRYPFLLVDRIVEFEEDRRIVGVKNVSSDERYFIAGPGGVPVLPASILTEAMAQTGAVLILAKPENRSRLIYFMGIDRVRYRRPVTAGDSVRLEAVVVRLRSRMGSLRGIARVGGRVVCEGLMTFALGDRPGAPAGS
jgi:3-hydroxyacyl-[acyl-carrier-protein] dehydratase